jgi:hypothetical protein
VNIRVLMLQGNKDPLSMPFDDLIDFIDRLQRSIIIEHQEPNSQEREGSKKRKTSDTDEASQKPHGKKGKLLKKYCSHCKMNNHNTVDCWFAKNGGKKSTPSGTYNNSHKNTSTVNKKEQTFTVEQMSALLAHLPSHVTAESSPPRKKRRILMDSSEEEFDTGDCESPSAYFAEQFTRSSTKGKK